MPTLNFKNIDINYLITHYVGRKQKAEPLKLSDESTDVTEGTFSYLSKYFLSPFKSEDYHAFYHEEGLEMNELYVIVKRIFEQQTTFVNDSQEIAQLLYHCSMHPKIVAGELNVAYLSNIVVGDEVVNAIGIFKSETQTPFLRMRRQASNYEIGHALGYQIKNIDKATIILNMEANDGYRVLTKDYQSTDALYWTDAFLNVRPIENHFYQTSQFLTLTNDYLTTKVKEDFEINKADQIDMQNRSVAYFKANDTYDKLDFEDAVFTKPEMVESFRNFDKQYQAENKLSIPSDFPISKHAVKRQAKVFKSILKLDKNFHVYIHGNRDMIEYGEEEDGRKYYKLYFEDEE